MDVSSFTLSQLRTFKKMSQQDLAKRLNVGTAALRRKEHGENRLYFDEVKILMETYDLSFSEIDKIIENTINYKNAQLRI